MRRIAITVVSVLGTTLALGAIAVPALAANLTPDKTGIGSWTEAQFIQTLRTGKHLGVGRPILPPMPWQPIGQLTDADLKAIFGYLKSLKPVDNLVLSNALRPAVVAMGKTLAREAAPEVRVNSILTGRFETDRIVEGSRRTEDSSCDSCA